MVKRKHVVNRCLNVLGLEVNKLPGYWRPPRYFPLDFPGVSPVNTIVDFVAPSGTGKTTLADAIRKEHGSNKRKQNQPRLQELETSEGLKDNERALIFLFQRRISDDSFERRGDLERVFNSYRWLWTVASNEREMLQRTRRSSYLVSHDGFFRAFGDTLLKLTPAELDTIDPLLRNRVALFLYTAPETVATRIKQRAKSGAIRSPHVGKAIDELSQMTARRLARIDQLSELLQARNVPVLHLEVSSAPDALVAPVVDWLRQQPLLAN